MLDWRPAEVVRRFAADLIRSASLAARLCRGLKLALADSEMSRADVASRMSDYLGETVTEAMLNAYVSEARGQHVINAVRLLSFLAVTQDPRPLNALLDEMGWVVIDKKYLPWIEVGMLREQRERLDRDIDFARRRAALGISRD
ncbi:DNA transposition protein [Mycobacterium sp. KBS0706]|uniref:DNA transposition protein n=1 Tax=Mycobacterium sp. KBS0706 TaxID=2578109 RepID=UPI00110FE485|nr:DNA transposition protein [Mycobacterium sp. KBS0706]